MTHPTLQAETDDLNPHQPVDGVAYGHAAVAACGLAVTLGLTNFVNLAHGAFAMAGGYVCMVLVKQHGLAGLRASLRPTW